MPVYLVERYLPGSTDVEGAVARLTEVVGGPGRDGGRAHLLWAARVPADETWFGWFEAPDAAAVADLHRRAAVPFDRISAAEVIVPLPDQAPTREDNP